MAGARHGMCELTRRGMTWALLGVCELDFTVPIIPKNKQRIVLNVSVALLMTVICVIMTSPDTYKEKARRSGERARRAERTD
jgi:hypothetical protein